MSIDSLINRRIDEGRLFLVEPVFDSDEADRTLLIAPEINHLIEGPWPNEKWEVRGNRLRADLENFASGGRLSVCVEPFEATKEDLGLLDPPDHGVWDLRSREPQPGLRLLGQFVAKDTFVALVPAMRSVRSDPPDFVYRGPLGDRNSREWRLAVRDTEILFRSLFLPFNAVMGDDIRDVLSGSYYSLRNDASG
jgi:hypothetical protein